ncbi:formate C-acetyltransferase [Streptomyces caniscabiei]|uniref:Formate acetyltransferase n=1 Tax=Streptomyces caniscabiei TaxID=2746961 RepID=A0ABU4MXE7_9ACTN|nr:formate C-acetyltransferase [Streptomyces caniscabiei]MBE4733545.1 formate C-acetyltransferase [Streptomyces caniscabiei]MBE4754722.1 formate C-acetyltransferase [Streptomyces caniscabiei]MBE4782040.1 formate C-acetyltransferase [Streptomyces caniscabiei]MDX2940560.1 formate C-acetyltransferase [Streptomyces caniscabiei]MDX2982805.1 formate C-acetyltransferase [Streptomyces caniscabiei]
MTATTTVGSRTSDAWRDFAGTHWREQVDVRDFIQANYTPYEGDAGFLTGPTDRTRAVWEKIVALFPEERSRGVLDVDTATPSTITSHAPGYIDRDRELIVGLQTDAPLKRAIMPNGGLRMVENGLRAYGYEPDPFVTRVFGTYRKTHNDGVFDAYTPEMRAARRAGIITGLPDSYGRGRIIGDYRRVALYGTDRLTEAKKAERALLDARPSTADVIRDREELAEQIRALGALARMAAGYGCDVSRPAATAHEAVQWLYLGYLAAVKEQNGAAMSLGRTSTFLDVYLQRDLTDGVLDETRAQELIDDFVIKLRIVRFLRTPEYDALFSGDPTWVTESIGGIGADGRPLVTRTSFRFLQTLYNLGPAPEPNLTVLWSPRLPEGFKRFCAQVSIDTSAVQYESDELTRPRTGDDTAIACCVSAMAVGRQMQFFGARVNLAKALLYAVNGGRDEMTSEQVAPAAPPLTGEYLDHEELSAAYDRVLDWLAATYVDALNVIHYMHDKYAYESIEMALHDHPVHRFMACGIAGLSVAVDSLSAVRYARVKVFRDATGLAVDFRTEGDFPTFGNNDDRADDIAVHLVESFMAKVRAHPTYRDAEHTQSVLTITSNVVYGKHTGNTPDGRRAGQPFAPGANPMNGRDRHGVAASALSVAKLPYEQACDGISLTTTVTPEGLGHRPDERAGHLVGILDAYTAAGGFHMNVNVLDRATLQDAMEHPEKYPDLTVRVSGYAVNFVRLTREQQLDVISRTFHGSM